MNLNYYASNIGEMKSVLKTPTSKKKEKKMNIF